MAGAASEFVIVETTLPCPPRGRRRGGAPFADVDRFARSMVERRLAACGHVAPAPGDAGGLRSHYWWNDRVEHEQEIHVEWKTTRAALGALVAAIRKEHPHDVPYIGVLPLELPDEPYAAWVRTNVPSSPAGPARPTRPRRR